MLILTLSDGKHNNNNPDYDCLAFYCSPACAGTPPCRNGEVRTRSGQEREECYQGASRAADGGESSKRSDVSSALVKPCTWELDRVTWQGVKHIFMSWSRMDTKAIRRTVEHGNTECKKSRALSNYYLCLIDHHAVFGRGVRLLLPVSGLQVVLVYLRLEMSIIVTMLGGFSSRRRVELCYQCSHRTHPSIERAAQ